MRRRSVKTVLVCLIVMIFALLFWQLGGEYQQLRTFEKQQATQNASDTAATRGDKIPNTEITQQSFKSLTLKAALYVVLAALTLTTLTALLRELRAKSSSPRRLLDQTTSALSTIDQPVLLTQTDGALHYLNRRAEIMLGQNQSAARGNGLGTLLPELADMLAAPFCEVQRRAVTVTREGETRRYTVERSGIGDQGEPAGYVWVMRDETASLHALATLEETRRRYQDIFEGSGVGLCVLDLSTLLSFIKEQGLHTPQALHQWLLATPEAPIQLDQRLRVTEANAMAQRLLGVTDNADISRRLTTHHPDCESVCQTIVSALIANDRHLEVEVCLECATGERHFWLTARFPERDEDFHAVTVSLNDMTSRKEMELSLIERERFWSGIAHAVPDALYVLDIRSRESVFSNWVTKSRIASTGKPCCTPKISHASKVCWRTSTR